MIRTLINPFKVGSRRWCLHWLSPTTYCRAIQEFCQRGKRGYADVDVWNLCDYLAEWLPDAMRLLREKGRTYPGEPCEGAATPEEWRERLKEIEDGFMAARLLSANSVTSSDHVPVEIRVPALELGASKERMCRNHEQHREKLRAKFETGVIAFYTYYFYLWD